MITERAAWIVLIGSFFTAAASQVLIKARFEALGLGGLPGEQPWSLMLRTVAGDLGLWLAAGLVIASALGWYLAMTRLPLSLMLPCSAVITPLVTIGAWAWLGESLGPSKVAAIGLITLGVAWLAAL